MLKSVQDSRRPCTASAPGLTVSEGSRLRAAELRGRLAEIIARKTNFVMTPVIIPLWVLTHFNIDCYAKPTLKAAGESLHDEHSLDQK